MGYPITSPPAVPGPGRGRRADDFSHRAIYLPWPDYVAWLRGELAKARPYGDPAAEPVPLPPPWKPGQHWAHIGKTGEG
jgi:hypothetical protein